MELLCVNYVIIKQKKEEKMPKRDYKNKYPSVTTILGVLRKIGLEFWFKQNTPQFIDETSKKGRKIGVEIHDAIEQFITNGTMEFETEYPDEVQTALRSFALFRKEMPEIELFLSEQALTSEKYKFNGTIDCIGKKKLIDWKTGECKDKDQPPIYDEYLYQVAAYVYLWNECYPDDILNEAIIVAVAKDKVAYNVHKMNKKEIDGCFKHVFLPALKIYNYQRKNP